jgi:hypothetical protein
MVIVPGLSLANQENQISLYSEITDRGFNLTKLLTDFYLGANAVFFVTLIIT